MSRRASIVLDDPNEQNLVGKRGNAPDMMMPLMVPPPATSPFVDFEIGDYLKSKNPAEILQDLPVVVEVNEFDEDGVKKFDADISRAMRTGQQVIPIIIDSYGGQVYCLFRILDACRAAKKRGFVIVTAAVGKAMSCGAVLLAIGEQRFVAEDAIVMIHDVSGWNMGKLPDIVSDAKHTEYLGRRLFEILDQASGKASGYWAQRVHDNGHADLYLSANEAKASGLANRIGTPQLTVSVKVEYEVS